MTTDGLDQIRMREQKRNAEIFKRRLRQECGGLLRIDEVQALLGLASEQAVREAVSVQELLAVEDEDELLFPLLQFDGRSVRRELKAILKAAPTTNGWRLLQYLLRSEDGLAGKRPVDLIRGSAEDIERAVRFANRLEQ